MIYVTVGNHDQPFDRLLEKMDELAGRLNLETVIQKGVSGYAPKNAKARDFFPFNEAEKLIREAEVVVGHAGIGTVISARQNGTPLIICPRRKANKEHFNDHQMEIARELIASPRPLVEVAMETDEIEEKLAGFLKMDLAEREKAAKENAGPPEELKRAIKDFIDSV